MCRNRKKEDAASLSITLDHRAHLTHAFKLVVERVQPVEVHVIQVVAAHGLRQLFDAHETRLLGLLAPALDVLLLVGVQRFLLLLRDYSEKKQQRAVRLNS